MKFRKKTHKKKSQKWMVEIPSDSKFIRHHDFYIPQRIHLYTRGRGRAHSTSVTVPYRFWKHGQTGKYSIIPYYRKIPRGTRTAPIHLVMKIINYCALKSNEKHRVNQEINLYQYLHNHLSKKCQDSIIQYYGVIPGSCQSRVPPPRRQYYLVLEAMKGDLFDYMEENQPTLSEIGSIGYQIALSVACLHQCDIVYHDLKTENVLISTTKKHPVIRLVDFDCSFQRRSHQQGRTRACHTVEYSSPEQCGSDHPVGISTDVWSWGILVYELLTKRIVHSGHTDRETIHLRKTVPITPPLLQKDMAFLPQSLSESQKKKLQQLLVHCLQFVPSQRPSMSQVAKRWSALHL